MTWKGPTSCPCGTLVGIFVASTTFAQGELPPDTAQEPGPLDKERCTVITGAAAGGLMGGTLLLLERAWYTQYERSTFHTFDDSGEWLQMDKAGHIYSAYTLGRFGHAAWARCGTSEKEAVLLGGGLGFLFLAGVEVLDGTSSGWGFSWTDMAANAAGTGLFMGQQLLWEEQRITVKFSAHPTSYAAQRPELLGEGLSERILKDYNGQTIWLSANVSRFASASRLPQWLSVAVGYGADGMLSAFPMEPRADGSVDQRTRRFFVSPDIDLTRIRTKSKFLRTALFVLNGIKVPMPAVEFRSNGPLRLHGLYF